MTAERMEELAPTAGMRDASIAFGISAEKMLLLNGDAIARIEVGPSFNIHEEFAKFHAETMKLVQAVEISSEIGLDGKHAGQKALGPASGENGSIEAGTDVLSVVSGDPSKASDDDDADIDADPSDLDGQKGDGLSQGAGGGRGSDAELGPAYSQTDNEPQNFINKGGSVP